MNCSMILFSVKALVLALLVGIASAKLIAPLRFSKSEAPCPVDDAGVAAPPVINENDDRFASFKRSSDVLEKWMNLSINPCEDFYGYACRKGQTNNETSLADLTYLSNLVTQLDAYNDDAYFVNAIKPLRQLKHLYDKCVNTDATAAAVSASIKTKFESLKKKIGVNFPMAYQAEKVSALSADDLANLLGSPIGELWVGTLVRVNVFNDLKAPDEISARVYIDQPILLYSSDVYTNWTNYKPKIESMMVEVVNVFAKILGVTLDQEKLKTDASAVAEMDRALGDYVTDKYTRRDFDRRYNLQTVDDLQKASPAYNWINLLKASLVKAQAPELIKHELEVVVEEPEQIAKLSKDIVAKKFDPETIANYIYYRVIIELLKGAPPVSDKKSERKTSELRRLEERGTLDRRDRKQLTIEKIVQLGEQLNLELPQAQVHCLQMANNNMPRAADRVYIDKIYPTPDSSTNIRRELEELTKWVFAGFRSQIDQISWMSAESKRGAYKKMDNIQLNILYTESVADDDQLMQFYSELQIEDSFNTIQTYDAILDFRHTRSIENFRLNKSRDRAEFTQGAATTTDMSYNPFFNAVNIFAGIAQLPNYDVDYPAAANFGKIGTLMGHELTHGFDDIGVQTDYVGALNTWMDDSSYAEFKKMASCVIDEYSGFCPTDDFCIDGVQTQGENIADNGGLIAAYNAFKDYEAYYGPDPRLPGFGSKFSNDQLFFLGFGNGWCLHEPTEEQYDEYWKTNAHSPNKYRVFGAIQNFPAFRAAFNCPIESAYAPKDHCDVWTSPPGE